MNRPVIGCAALALVLSMPAPAKSPSNDEKEVHSFTLTTGFLEKMIAIQEKAASLAEAHPELEKQGAAAERQHRGENDNSIDGMVKKMESVPPLANLIKAEGLTVRQYTVGLMALLEVGVYAAFKKQMPDMKKPEGMNLANLAFVETHQAEMDKFEQRMRAAQGHKKQKSNAPVEQEENQDDGK